MFRKVKCHSLDPASKIDICALSKVPDYTALPNPALPFCAIRWPGVEYGQILCIKGSIEMTSQLPPIADIPIPDHIPEDDHWWLWSQSTRRIDLDHQVRA